MTEMFEAATEVLDETVGDLFPPKPGGLVHRHRARVAEREAEIEEATDVAEPIEQSSYRAVKVAQQSPENFTALTYTIAAGGYAPILPMNMYRSRAVVMLITASATMVLAKDSGNAISGSGFVTPANIPIPLFTRAQVYAFNNTAGSIQVSVFAEMYSPEGS